MARIDGIEGRRVSFFARIVFFLTKRRLGRVIMPIRITAHHPRLLRGYVHMELAQDAAKSVPAALKTLVDVAIARWIGCPF